MVDEERIRIEDENNSNREEKKASSENVPEESTVKFLVEKGKGTPLKDIPNFVSKLDEKLLSFSTTLHYILYGEHDEVEDAKKDVLEFSGFVPNGNEENQRESVKERLDECTREMLARLCSIFDIPLKNGGYGKQKKEIIELLLDFLEAPDDAAEEEANSSAKEVFHQLSTSERVGRSTYKKPYKKFSCESDISTSLVTLPEEVEERKDKEDEIAPGNELEEMRCSEKEESNTVSEKPKDRCVILSKNVSDMNEEEKKASSENAPEEFTEKFLVEKGKGTPLKDIPNFVSKLDEKLLSFSTSLHYILYGEHDEVEDAKKDVLEFSGFVPHGNEENQRESVKERLDECTREMLARLCSIFDIPLKNGGYGKQRIEIIELLLDFLEAPHDATEEEANSSDKEVFHQLSTSERVGRSTYKKPYKKFSCESDISTSLVTLREEVEERKDKEDEIAPGNELEEMRCSEKEESNNTVSEKPKDRCLILSKDVSDMNEEEKKASSENVPEESTVKFLVEKGKGTPLKDIPNFVSKLDEKLLSFSTSLHYILYGEHDEVEDAKKDVLEFSGFVLHGDEENQRESVKERLDECTREMLARLCSIFDIPLKNGGYGKQKIEIIELLLDFLEAPYDATEEEANSSDNEIPLRKRKLKTIEVSFTSERVLRSTYKKPYKKLSSESDISTSLVTLREENEERKDKEDKIASGNELEEIRCSEKEDEIAPGNELEEMRCSEKEESSTVSEKPKDRCVILSKNVSDMNEGSRGDASFDLNDKYFSEKLTKSVWELEKSNRKQNSTERRVAQGGDKPPKEWCDPSCEEVQEVISVILEKMDITTATFSDLLEELDEHFEMDISPRKDEIKVMIEEELYKLADEAQEKASSEECEEEKDAKIDENENSNGNMVSSIAEI